jgi:hypothetical protein
MASVIGRASLSSHSGSRFVSPAAWLGPAIAAPAMALQAMPQPPPMRSTSSQLQPGLAGSLLPPLRVHPGSRPASSLTPAEVAGVTRRFSNLGVVCVATLLITGVINAWFIVRSVAILLGSSYGQIAHDQRWRCFCHGRNCRDQPDLANTQAYRERT